MHSMENEFIFKYKSEIYQFIRISEVFFDKYQEQISFMNPDYPLATVLFGEFADAIKENYRKLDIYTIKNIFCTIEYMLNKNDNFFKTVIVTGLLESLTLNLDIEFKNFLEKHTLKETKYYISNLCKDFGC